MASSAGSRSSASPRSTLAVCLATGLATLLDQAVVTVAAPSLRAGLSATTGELQWILASYSLTFGIALVPAGRLGDRIGRRRLLIAGLLLFSLSSVIAATAANATILILARLVQGLGAGIANPQVHGLIQDSLAGVARARAIGAYTSIGATAALFAPLLAGSILVLAGTTDGWRWVFFLNVPIGLVTAWFARRRVLESDLKSRPGGLDLGGLGLLTLAVLALLMAVIGSPLAAVPAWAWLVVCAVAVGALIGWERGYARRGREPILHPALAKAPGFLLGAFVAMFSFGAALGAGVALTLFLQEGLGLSPLNAGLVSTPAAAASIIATRHSHKLLARFGRRVVTIALASMIGVHGVIITLALTTPMPWLVVALVLAQLTVALFGSHVSAPNSALSYEHVPAGSRGLAAGFYQVSQRISSTFSIAVVTGVVAVAAIGGDASGYRWAFVRAELFVAGLLIAALAASLVAGRVDRRRALNAAGAHAEATGAEIAADGAAVAVVGAAPRSA